jgi:glycosyltransferase 2 family protein
LNSKAATGKSRLIRVAKLVFRLTVLTLVGIGIWQTVRKALAELQVQQFSWRQVEFHWLAISGVVYLAATAPCWVFWHRTLQAMGQRPGWLESLRAYYIGHLGKYVPGKAFVVVIRSGLIRSPRVDTAIAVTAVFVETLTMMAAGAFVAAAILAVLYRDQTWLLVLAIGMMIGIGGPTVPPIFRRVIRVLGVKRLNPDIEHALAGLDWRLMLFGWLVNLVGWALMGLSLWLTLRALPTIVAVPVELEHLPRVTCCVALALVAGFLSLVPGGIVVREYVVMTLLSGTFGVLAATICAIVSRLVGVLAELAFGAVLYGAKGRS